MNRKIVLILSLLFCLGYTSNVSAQGTFCPTNVDFESGTFGIAPNIWNCFRGQNTNAGGTYAACTAPEFVFTACAPAPTLHTIESGVGTDTYGGFPVVAPGGGSYSLKIGKDTSNYNADGVIYWLHVPAGTTNYSLIYHYAVVVEDPAGHCFDDQPRMTAEAFDSLTGHDLSCDSFCYVGDGSVPGFTASTVESIYTTNGFDVLFKPWTTGNFKFGGENGKTVGLRFGAGGCTQSGHFGYGYVDMSCGLFAISTISCGATFVTLAAPPGYQFYRWTDSATYTITYGTTPTSSAPPPAVPTTYAVICTPYVGYGCTDTLYTRVTPTDLSLSASPDTAICLGGSATLLTGATDVAAGLPVTYSWAPSAGLSCTGCANPVATPTVTTAYTVTVTNAVGCPQTHVYNITVYPNPAPITGGSTVCAGATTTLGDPTAGGHWTSGNTSIASVGSGTGTVTGGAVLVPTVVTITYSYGTAGICGVTKVLTVNPDPVPILGPTSVCLGSTITLTDATGGGTWASSLTTIATVGSTTGIVGGVALSTISISYMLTTTGCITTHPVTVVGLPSPITGLSSLCVGTTSTFIDPGGGSWSSSNTSAIVGSLSGLVTGVHAGLDTISYTLGTGCTRTATVNIVAAPSPIMGPGSVCDGGTITLTDGTTGGFWVSSNPSMAAIGPFTGIVTGGSISGIDTITYSSGGCPITMLLTVNPLPGPISGTTEVCSGATTPFFDAGTGTWSSFDATIATVGSSSGIVGGVITTGGSTTITYTLPTGCFTTIAVAVDPLPSPVSGPTNVCVGGTITLLDGTFGGAWSSSDTLAVVDPSGNVTGVGGGTAIISYTSFPSECSIGYPITIDPTPPAISGLTSLCSGSTTTWTDPTTGGTWSSSSATIATVGSATGFITAGSVVTASSATITYSSPGGCIITQPITVYPLPSAISGVTHMCVGSTTTLNASPAGGTWSSSNTAIATVGSALGVVHGAGAGIATIVYSISYGGGTFCTRSIIVTVNSTPGPVNGILQVCSGSTTALTDTTAGGTWASSNPTVAAVVGSSGVVTGGTTPPTTATITYSLGGSCVATAVVTVNPLPGAITGTTSVCVGSSVTLTSGGAGTWISSNTSIATVGTTTGSVAVYGASPGISVITYILPTGCSRSIPVTVNALPKPIAGLTGAICAGAVVDLTDSTVAGTWASSSIATASVISGTGVLTGGNVLTVLTSTITYKVTSTGCSITTIVTVDPLPPLASVTGSGSYCPGTTSTLTPCLNPTTIGISYQMFNGAIPVGAPLTGTGGPLCWPAQPAGTYTIVATNPLTGCNRTMTGSAIITVYPSPAPIGGPSALCVGATIDLTDPVPCGTWSPATGAVVDISPTTGVVTGISTGVGSITFTSCTGCKATTTVTVSLSPTAVIGPAGVCVGACDSFTDGVPGGLWTSSNTAAAIVGSLSGVVCGEGIGGIATISYSLGSTGCTVSKPVSVAPAPLAIGGPAAVCIGGTIPLTDGTAGGTWLSSDVTIASVSPASGVLTTVTGGSSGSVTISYTVGGCSRTSLVTVNPLPSIITGPSTVCAGLTITKSDSVGGGTWTSSASGIASVGSTGIVTGGAVPGPGPSTATITYSLGTGCVKTSTITVFPAPGPISSTTTLHDCIGSTITLHDVTTGGAWVSLNTTIATVGSSSGIIYSVSPGTDTITYTAGAGCSVRTVVTINPLPDTISGSTNVCEGSCISLADGSAGGLWSSGNTNASVGSSSGLVCGNTPGFDTVTYTLSTGCAVHVKVTIETPPPAITTAPSVCAGLSITASDSEPGGHWYSVNPDIATIDSVSGDLTGIASGTVIISYTVGSGCSKLAAVIVNPLSPVTGDSIVCVGQTIMLTDTTEDGVWASSVPATASVVTASTTESIVTGGAAGVVTITYTLPTGCTATRTVTVQAAPPPISGLAHVCLGLSDTLSDGPGTWTSSNSGVALIADPTIGSIYGADTGVAIISFTNSATTCPRTLTFTVNPLPGPIDGPADVCVGSTIILSDPLTGGTWSSSASAVASVDLTTGHVHGGASPGSVLITYTLPTGCSVSTVINVDSLPAPITGNLAICVGATTTLSDASSGTIGGTWSGTVATEIVVDLLTGDVTGEQSGVYTVSFITPVGCAATALVTVNAIPVSIAPSSPTICQDATIVMTDFPAGGRWTSGTPSVATIDSMTGHLLGTGPGSSVITYTIVSTGCSANTLVFVNPAPDPIIGSAAICDNTVDSLIDSTSGGAWTSSNTLVATVDGVGNVSGFNLGTSAISYMVAGCPAILNVTVNPEPDPIPGAQVCQGSAIIMADGVAGGSWTSDDVSIASIGLYSGVLTGESLAGTVNITYSLGVGCTTSTVVTVNPIPALITGLSQICAFMSSPYFETTAGGTWSSSNTAAATITSASGLSTVLYGAPPGGTMTVLSYTTSLGCFVSDSITVNQAPAPIVGSHNVCIGTPDILIDTVYGGTWSSSSTGIATVDSMSGSVTGLTIGGTATIYYSIGGVCTVSKQVTVDALPTVFNVTGGGNYCEGGLGEPVGLDNSVTGVNYILYQGLTATGTFPGSGSPLNFGLQTVAGSYTVIATSTITTCSNYMSGSATISIITAVVPAVGINSVPGDTVCAGTSITFTALPSASAGGGPTYQWSVNGTNVSTSANYTFIPANGDVVAVTMHSSPGACVMPAVVTHSVTMTVNPHHQPSVSISLSPGDTVCQGSTISLTPVPSYGGLSPVYTWLKNGYIAATGGSYSYIPENGDSLRVVMVGDYPCVLGSDTVSSVDVVINVDTIQLPIVSINASPGTNVGRGEYDTLRAVVVNGGVYPIYQWYVNGYPVASATTNTYISNNFDLTREDSVSCMVTSDAVCPATSHMWVYINASNVGVKQVASGVSDINVIPNPNKGEFMIKGNLGTTQDEDVSLEITDMIGQVVYKNTVTAHNGIMNEKITLSNNLANGMYMLSLHSESDNKVFHIVIEQ